MMPLGHPHQMRASRTLTMSAFGNLGIFDTHHEDDPSVANKVWRAYSSVEIDNMGNPTYSGFPGWWAVSTMISSSTDNGTSWGTPIVVNRAVSDRRGYLRNYEVPTLCYDAGDADAQRRWKLVYMVTGLNKSLGGTYFDTSMTYIGMKTAPAADGPWSAEIRLLAGSAFSASNAMNPGAVLLADAAGLMVAEPGIIGHPTSGFYMIYQCQVGTPATDLHKLVRIHHNGTTWVKTDIGQPINVTTDSAWVRSIGGIWAACAGFSAMSLCKGTGGANYYLLYTPINASYDYMGYIATVFTNIATATLSRSGGNPVPAVAYNTGTAQHHGMATFSPKSTGSGISLGVFDPALFPTIFNIVQFGGGATLP